MKRWICKDWKTSNMSKNPTTGDVLIVEARTKGEAKAQFRKLIGVKRTRSKSHPKRSKGTRPCLPMNYRVTGV